MIPRAVRAALGTALLALALSACVAVVDVTEYGVVTRFGRVVRVVTEPGLVLKLPFPIDRVTRLDRRLLTFKPVTAEYLSEDKKNLIVHSLVTWRIVDPVRYLATVGERAAAERRLADLVLARIGGVLGRHSSTAPISLDPRRAGLERVSGEILAEARAAAQAAYGADIVDVRLRQLNLPEQNRANVFARMQAERGKIAMSFRSEGERESKKIVAEAEREKARITAEAYREAERTRAEGDAQAMRIYGEAFGRNRQFYKFLRTLQAYEKILDSNTTLFLPADADVLRVLKDERPPGAAR